MSRYSIAILLAIYTCVGWGLLTPFAVKLSEEAGPEKFHPLQPFLWGTFGSMFIAFVMLVFTNFSPLRGWTWHWSGWAIAFAWASASVTFVYALSFAVERASIPNAVAAAYPFLVSAPILWYFLGETMTTQRVIGIIGMFFFMLVAVFG